MLADYLDQLYSTITCCLSDDKHLAKDAVLLKCGANACAKCAKFSSTVCSNCKLQHNSSNDSSSVRIDIKSTIDLLIKSNYSKVIQHLNSQRERATRMFVCLYLDLTQEKFSCSKIHFFYQKSWSRCSTWQHSRWHFTGYQRASGLSEGKNW